MPPAAALRALPAWGRLVTVHRDGSDGPVFALAHEHVAIGRTDGEITFADDRYLAPRHVQLERRGAQALLRVLDPVNGAYVRLVEPHALSDGDQFLFGKQVMRFEMVAPPERDAPPAIQHGVLVFGSPPRATWGRLRQLLTTGQTRDVIHLSRSDVIMGREEGELRFPDDEFMSRRHATLSQRDGRVHLADLGSSNGTYVRLRGERELRAGDLIRVGDQLLRFEPA
jgi:pSer/pThr/pTyr-binding forkhead associated (FHA) protein